MSHPTRQHTYDHAIELEKQTGLLDMHSFQRLLIQHHDAPLMMVRKFQREEGADESDLAGPCFINCSWMT